jgi:tetratricopeptide (TPR) repeat protein
MLHICAALAEKERALISERTKAALRAAKAGGMRLGNPRLSEAHQDLQRFDEALSSYARAVAVKPDYVEAHFNRGELLQRLVRYREALSSYDRALAIKPDHYQALNGRGNALLDQGQVDEAMIRYRRALAIKPDEPVIHSNLIFAMQLRRGDDYGGSSSRTCPMGRAARTAFRRGDPSARKRSCP